MADLLTGIVEEVARPRDLFDELGKVKVPSKLNLIDRIILFSDIVSSAAESVSRRAPDPDRGIPAEIGTRFSRGIAGAQKSAGGLVRLATGQIERVTGETVATHGLEAVGSAFEALGRTGQAVLPPSQGNKFGARNILGTIAEAAPQVIAQTGIAAVTGGGSLPIQIAIFSGLAMGPVVGDQYLDALEFHREKGTPNPENAAALEAGAAGLITAGTNIIPGIAILRKTPAGQKVLASAARRAMARVGRVGTAGGAEALQEMSEQVLTDATASLLRDDPEMMRKIVQADPEYWSSIGLAGIAGFVLGGGARVGIEVASGTALEPTRRPERAIQRKLVSSEDAAQFVKSQPEAALKLANVKGVPSQQGFQRIPGAIAFTVKDRVRFQQLVQEQLDAQSRTQEEPTRQPAQAQEEGVQPQVEPRIEPQAQEGKIVPSGAAQVRALDRSTGTLTDITVSPENTTKTLRDEKQAAVQLRNVLECLGRT